MSRLMETFRAGALEITAISDGAPDRALGGFFHGVPAEEWTKALGLSGPDELVPFNMGAFLVRGDGRTTLVDSGLGVRARAMGIPGGGELPLRLAELGVRPDEIDTVVHTHLHFDHCGWDIDGTNGNVPAFPNADVYVSERELSYWFDAANDGKPQVADARANMTPLREAGRVKTFKGEFSVTTSLTMIPTPGHTPGHCSVLLTSEGQHLLILGDAAHHPKHLEHHDWIPQVDVDPAQSRLSRAKVAGLAADRNALVTGGHFPILTLGRVRREGGRYRWEAVG